MVRVYNKQKLVRLFAVELAYLQNAADWWYYILKDQEMSSCILDDYTEAKNIAYKLGILQEATDAAKQIYDYSDSGKSDFVPDLDYIVDIHNYFSDYHDSRLFF